jgi:hypothetical protein
MTADDDTARQLNLLGVIRDDLEREALHLDGLTVDGATLAPIFGRMLAAISAVAMVIERHLGDTS